MSDFLKNIPDPTEARQRAAAREKANALLTAPIVASTNPKDLYEAAERAAVDAVDKANALLPPEQSRGLDCGFAWVVIRPARGPLVNWLKKNQIGHSHHAGGWCVWKPGHANTQSLSVHEAGAQAFRDVLVANGINAETGSRYD